MSGFEALPLHDRVLNFRKLRGWSQAQLAVATGVTQSQVSRWEKGLDRPSPAALAAIARLADEGQRASWVAETGMSQLVHGEDPDNRQVPILLDPAAAGTPREVNESSIERYISLPRDWLPKGGKLYGIRVKGDSMSPLVNDGYLVLVDVAVREASVLRGKMVAARDRDGVTIKWLRLDDGLYFLIPNRTSERHPIRVLQPHGEWSLIGEVVKIIGDPPKPKRK